MTLYFPYRAVILDDPYSRLKAVVKWYLSGFYKKPKVHNCLNECIFYMQLNSVCAFLLIFFFIFSSKILLNMCLDLQKDEIFTSPSRFFWCSLGTQEAI